jgi:hypothetical protein
LITYEPDAAASLEYLRGGGEAVGGQGGRWAAQALAGRGVCAGGGGASPPRRSRPRPPVLDVVQVLVALAVQEEAGHLAVEGEELAVCQRLLHLGQGRLEVVPGHVQLALLAIVLHGRHAAAGSAQAAPLNGVGGACQGRAT